MLNDEVLEKLLLHPNMKDFCLYQQTQIINIFDDVVQQMKEEKPYASISELLSKSNV